jgi:hypothetical protein
MVTGEGDRDIRLEKKPANACLDPSKLSIQYVMLTSEADDLMMLWSELIAERARGTCSRNGPHS